MNQAGATPVWFKASAGDYAPLNGNAIGRYVIATGSLNPGTYVITPFGQELTNANVTVTSFATPGSFSLTIIPEPEAFLLLATGGIVLLARRRRRF